MVYIKKTSQILQFIKENELKEKLKKQHENQDVQNFMNDHILYKDLKNYVKKQKDVKLEDLFKVDEDIVYTLQYNQVISDLDIVNVLIVKDPEIKEFREKLRYKAENRVYTRYQKQTNTESVKDIEKSIGFGVSFIFTIFLSGLSGYLFADQILEFNRQKSLIVAAFFLISTMIIETVLFIIKTTPKKKIKQQ